MNNADYWARRMKIMEDALKDKSYEYVKNLEEQFDIAISDIEKQLRAWYQRFSDNNGGMSYSDAQKLLNSEELKEFKWTVEQYIKAGKEHAVNGAWEKELENASARVHISRLESLKTQLRQQAEILTQESIQAASDASELSYTQSYYHTAFEVQRGLGVGWTLQALNSNAVQKVLSRPWTADNQTFTARCWTDKAKLIETVNQEITRMLATGSSPDKAINAITKRFKVSKQNAGRLVMTESAYFSSAAQKDCFNELGVEKYRVVGTLDTKTCSTCGDMDGKVFKMSEFSPGSTAPPFHPWCRCCTAPYYEDMDGIGERYARDAKTGESYKLPKDITYKEWKALQDEAYGHEFVDKTRKYEYNKNADMLQFERYKSVIGDVVPDNLDDFQKIKYESPDTWEKLKYQYRTVNRYEVNGNVPTEKIIELDNAAWYTKQTGFDCSKFTGDNKKKVKNLSRSGNAAAMEFDGMTFFSHSQAKDENSLCFKSYTGKYSLIGMQKNRQFNVLDLGDGVKREYDTEAKFLEFVATQKKEDERFSVTILSEKHMCKSCAGVVEQFKNKYPKATVNVISGRTNYNGSESGNKTWAHRKKVEKNVKTH